MNLNMLIENFDLLETPESIDELKKTILELAVRGKLVPQDPNDEPASELLKKIQAEKKKLITEKKIKKNKPLPTISDKEKPYQLPNNWEWTNLYNLGIINPRNNIEDSMQVSFVPMKNISPNYGEQVISEEKNWYEIKKGFTHFANKDVVLAKITPCFQNRKSTVVNNLINGYGAGTTELHVFRPIKNCTYSKYILIYLRTPSFINNGILNMTGSAGQKRVPRKYFSETPVPLPPLNEQKRIVAKVDELFDKCDQLKEKLQQAQSKSQILTQTSLERLSAISSKQQFNKNWQFLTNNFDVMIQTPQQVQELRQTILQLAVMGKLVPQDPNDEPASKLLKRIQAEKEKLIAEKKIQKDKKISPLLKDKKPEYKVPSSWSWIRLQQVFEVSRGGSPRPSGDPKYFGGNIPWITVAEITKDKTKYLTSTKSSLTEEGKNRSRLISEGDLLLTNSGATLGVPKISKIKGCINDGVALLRQFHSFNLNYYMYVFLTNQTDKFRNINQGMGQPNLNTSILASWYVPIPPLNEQKRIVDKVEELFAKCNNIEQSLTKSLQQVQLISRSILSLQS